MTFRVQDLVRVSDKVRKYGGREGVVAAVHRVNPRSHSVVIGERLTTRTVRGKHYEHMTAILEEQPLAPVYEIGVDFASLDAKAELRITAWFRPDELIPVVAKSQRPLKVSRRSPRRVPGAIAMPSGSESTGGAM